MIVITKGVQKDIYVTLNDSVTISNPFFLFVFTNVSTKEQIKVIVNSTDDKSSYPERVNQFEIDVALFDNASVGQWHYNVYEQDNGTNEDVAGLTMLENGKMLLKDSIQVTDFVAEFAPQTQFI
jgi:hypothetical protein